MALTSIAADTGTALLTLRRWHAAHTRYGLRGRAHIPRADTGAAGCRPGW